jgi:hypothetical protein
MAEVNRTVQPSPASGIRVVMEKEDDEHMGMRSNGGVNSNATIVEGRIETQSIQTRSESSTEEETNQSILVEERMVAIPSEGQPEIVEIVSPITENGEDARFDMFDRRLEVQGEEITTMAEIATTEDSRMEDLRGVAAEIRIGKNSGKGYVVSESTPIFACRVGQRSDYPDCTYARCRHCFVEPSESGIRRVGRRGKKRTAMDALEERSCCHDMPALLRYWEGAYFNQERYRDNKEKYMPTECGECDVGFYDKLPKGMELCGDASPDVP